MKFKFKIQPYQTEAVESVIGCFAGQINTSGIKYRIDPGKENRLFDLMGFKNADVQFSDAQLLENIHAVQRKQGLLLSDKIVYSAGCRINLDIEMETGTGKTYCYIKTIFEMNKRYGWSKFIIVVPSIAIREGVNKSLKITANHFAESFGKRIRFFIYNSKELQELENFSSDGGINVMIINIQAFNATGKDNLRIYEVQDDFQSRRPIDVISSNRPILILDEPQKMEGAKTLEALAKFKPLMILRYSATHRTSHNKIYRLDALDAYNQKLVKKITVRGITVKGLAGTNAYLYLGSIEISKKAPAAIIEMEVKQKDGIKRATKRLEKGRDLFEESNGLRQYRGFVISQIDANQDIIEFTNGHMLKIGEATGDVTEAAVRRIQIRETIEAHLEKEKELFSQGIKVLSLFFIDEVVKYRDYSQSDEQGDYARIFEEEYERCKLEFLNESGQNKDYRKYLSEISVRRTHSGYFSIDKKTKKLTDPHFKTRGEDAGISDDVDAYDLILKDKERLLSFEEPVRFIFSHSALREGWDNPNVFVMCMLKQSNNDISRKQEVGRGLRLSVNANGDRMDDPLLVHEINILTVVTSESYIDFVVKLQREISDSLSSRPRKADVDYFTGKEINTEEGPLVIDKSLAKQIYKYLQNNDYIDHNDSVSEAYHLAKNSNNLAALSAQLNLHKEEIFDLVDKLFCEYQLPDLSDDRKRKVNPLNSNFEKKEFKELWDRISPKVFYHVEFESSELVENSIVALNNEMKVSPLQYAIQVGIQDNHITDSQLKKGESFQMIESKTETDDSSIRSCVKYDLIGEIAEMTQLTRKTIAQILKGIKKKTFDQFKYNPEKFIAEVGRLINEQKATTIIKELSYDETEKRHEIDIFTATQIRHDFSKASKQLNHHIYDYLISESEVERNFVKELDTSKEVVVYAKLPRSFHIPTPVGPYHPDWAISFKEGSVKHIYFVAETKGSMSTMQLRGIENSKIECARKFFKTINRKINSKHVKYDVVDSYGKLMEITGMREAS